MTGFKAGTSRIQSDKRSKKEEETERRLVEERREEEIKKGVKRKMNEGCWKMDTKEETIEQLPLPSP
jgi:hypothetical protein